MSHWAALVYSRTYEVDFRLMAMPEDFADEDKQWALSYILGTTRSPEKISAQPRWSFFKNQRYCVVGVTCMAKELAQDSGNEDITRDMQGRPLYAFMGYVAKLDGESELLPLPAYSDQVELFKPLYRYVSDCWTIKSYQITSQAPVLTAYQPIEFDRLSSAMQSDKDLLDYFALNCANPQIVRLWTEADREQLWSAAIEQLTPQTVVSLCLGLANSREALESPFLNATVAGVRQREDLPKAPKQIKSSALQPEETSFQPAVRRTSRIDFDRTASSQSLGVEPVEVVGLCLGAVVGGAVTSGKIVGLSSLMIGSEIGLIAGIPGILLGGTVGWIASGVLTKQGVSGAMIQKTYRWVSDASRSRTKRRSRPARRKAVKPSEYGLSYREETDQLRSKNSQEDSEWF